MCHATSFLDSLMSRSYLSARANCENVSFAHTSVPIMHRRECPLKPTLGCWSVSIASPARLAAFTAATLSPSTLAPAAGRAAAPTGRTAPSSRASRFKLDNAAAVGGGAMGPTRGAAAEGSDSAQARARRASVAAPAAVAATPDAWRCLKACKAKGQ